MARSPDASSDLFAAKGRALPACSEQIVKRSVGRSRPADVPGEVQASDRAEDEAQEGGTASVLSIDVRSVLVSAPAPLRLDPPVQQVSDRITALPPLENHGMAGPLIAAVVAISIAAGLFYVFGPHRLDGTPVADTPSPASVANAPAAGAASQPTDDESGAAPTAESGADPAAEEKAAEDGSLPSFDLVRVEPDGAAVIAGRAAPYAELILLHNGEPIGKAKADWAGEWAFVTDRPLPADRHTITILLNDPDAEVTLPQGANPPAEVSDLVNSGSR